MLKRLIMASTVLIVVGISVFAGQNTGGDKTTTGLNPQPLPPGRHHQYRSNHKHKHKHRHSTAYSPQWGGNRQPNSKTNAQPK
jgi:hypothetical protein